jgi:predicted nucleotide-binding protein
MLRGRQADGTFLVSGVGQVTVTDDLLEDAKNLGRPVVYLCRHFNSAESPMPIYRAYQFVPDEDEEEMEPNTEVSGKQPIHKNEVFVIHGRNAEIRLSVERFLRSVGITPIEWSKAIALTNTPNPYTWQIVDTALTEAAAIVVLFTPDDEAKLRDEFIKQSDEQYESELTPQPRANVLFEAGVAFGRSVQRTLMISVGKIRPVSDLAGHHILRLNNSPESRLDFINRLKSAGCEVDIQGTSWLHEGDFSIALQEPVSPAATPKVGQKPRMPRPSDVAIGNMLEPQPAPAPSESEVAPYSEEDSIMILQDWLERSQTELKFTLRFADVDTAAKVPAGTAKKFLHIAAGKSYFDIVTQGDNAIRLAFNAAKEEQNSGRDSVIDALLEKTHTPWNDPNW